MSEKKSNTVKKKHRILFLAVIILIMACAVVYGSLSAINSTDKSAGTAENEDNGKITLKFHYARNDGAYDPWSLWVWEDSEEGKDYSFTEIDEKEACVYVSVDNKTLETGYVIHTQDWEKDVTADRSVDLSEIAGGTVEIYLTQGVEEAKIKEKGVLTSKPKVVEAVYDGEYDIAVKVSDMSKDFHYTRSVLCE